MPTSCVWMVFSVHSKLDSSQHIHSHNDKENNQQSTERIHTRKSHTDAVKTDVSCVFRTSTRIHTQTDICPARHTNATIYIDPYVRRNSSNSYDTLTELNTLAIFNRKCFPIHVSQDAIFFSQLALWFATTRYNMTQQTNQLFHLMQ